MATGSEIITLEEHPTLNMTEFPGVHQVKSFFCALILKV